MSFPKKLRSPVFRWGLVALIQLALIAIPLADRLEVQRKGTEVTLDLRPVDPRDLLRGDYVIVNLAISQVPWELYKGDKGVRSDRTVYASLEIGDNGIAKVIGVSNTRAEAGPLAIKGTYKDMSDRIINIDYGIDAFYLPEGEGKEIERLPAKRVQVVVAVHPDGRALPLRLLVDGEEFKSDAAF